MKRYALLILILIFCSVLTFAEFYLGGGTGSSILEEASLQEAMELHMLGGFSVYNPFNDYVSLFIDATGYAAAYPVLFACAGKGDASVDISYKKDFFILQFKILSQFEREVINEDYLWKNIGELYIADGNLNFSWFVVPRFKFFIGREDTWGPAAKTGLSFTLGDTLILSPLMETTLLLSTADLTALQLKPALNLTWYPGGNLTASLESVYEHDLFFSSDWTSSSLPAANTASLELKLTWFFSNYFKPTLTVPGEISWDEQNGLTKGAVSPGIQADFLLDECSTLAAKVRMDFLYLCDKGSSFSYYLALEYIFQSK